MPHSKLIMIGLDAVVATLAEKYLAAGQMPNLAQLIRRGASTRARALFPGVTPINWATISTGAKPGAHGIPDFFILEPGDPLDSGRDSFDAGVYQAETLWEAAGRAGLRTATINFPGATPPHSPNQYWIAGRGSPAGISAHAIRPTSCFASPACLPDLREAEPLDVRSGRAAFHLKPWHDPHGEGPRIELEPAEDRSGRAGMNVFLNGDSTPADFLLPGQPGAWLWAGFRVHGEAKQGSFRLELVRFNPAEAAFAVYVSEVTSPADIARPGWLGQALVERHGPFIDYSGGRGYDRGWTGIERMVEEGLYKGLWQAACGRHAAGGVRLRGGLPQVAPARPHPARHLGFRRPAFCLV